MLTGEHVKCFEISFETTIWGNRNVKIAIYLVADFVLKVKKYHVLLETIFGLFNTQMLES